ncbi:DUF6978 family protein [Companilactobacillus nantensis]|nr:hypothetical protein [Companilactobacillus nantensis]GEO63001.1 hypothetical protein LNA01_01840 [Companilactobacillus nantensis]
MESLDLTDADAYKLISIFKKTISKNKYVLTEGSKGKIKISGLLDGTERQFVLYYMYAIDNIHLNFSDASTRYTLVRINLDSSFHKNSDGKVYGHRVEIFSEEEYRAKNDTFTHYKAYPLPHNSFKDCDDFFTALQQMFDYTNVKNHSSISFIEDNILSI